MTQLNQKTLTPFQGIDHFPIEWSYIISYIMEHNVTGFGWPWGGTFNVCKQIVYVQFPQIWITTLGVYHLFYIKRLPSIHPPAWQASRYYKS